MSERDIKVQAIINPISGVGSKRKIPKMIEGICSKKNCSLNISFTEYAGHASELTRQAIEEGAEYILAESWLCPSGHAPCGSCIS